MNRKLWIAIIMVMIAFVFFSPEAGRADGIIIPEPPICPEGFCPPPPCPGPRPCPPMPPIVQLAIRYHRVNIVISDQIATTKVDQVFYNPNEYPIEGTYIFPLPKDAMVSSFLLWVDGEPVEGKVLDVETARRQYEDIVRSTKDPALLEYIDRGAVQAHIFPIPAKGERRVALEYIQTLSAEAGLVEYTYPLNTEKFSLWPLDEVAINAEIRSSKPIRVVYSPTHEVAITRQSDKNVTVGYEATNVRPDKDFSLYYSIGEAEAFHLLTFRDPTGAGDPDGFFLLMLAPRPEISANQAVPKDIVLILDRSGSMEGEKFLQAQEALRYILKHINPDDRFNVIAFSTGIDLFANTLRSASESEQAIEWVERLSAQGSTDINRALLEASTLVDKEKPTYLIFLTDGLPTIGVVDTPKILANLIDAIPSNVRLFSFGVGYDVDTLLLDSLSQNHHGSSMYVLPGVKLDEVLSDFYNRISTPVLTNLKLDFGEIITYDMFPFPLPDLFKGSQIIVVGRNRNYGVTNIKLTGSINGSSQTFTFSEQIFDNISLDNDGKLLSVLPRIWATRKIGNLLNQIRLNGPDQETIDQIVKLSIRYGIVTPYTSYLVTEQLPLGIEEQERIAADQYNQMLEMPTAPSYGQQAVEKAMGEGAMADANAPVESVEEAMEVVKIVDAHTFVLSDGVWIDTMYDAKRMQTMKVAFLSDDYFKLLAEWPELGKLFALAERVIVVVNGKAIEVVGSDAQVTPIELPKLFPIPSTQGRSTLVSTPIIEVEPTAVENDQNLGHPWDFLPCVGLLFPFSFLPMLIFSDKRKN